MLAPGQGAHDAVAVAALLGDLPEWFGRPDANAAYAASVGTMTTLVARHEDGGPSDPDANYAATRAFYTAMGFIAVEESDAVWPGTPCLTLVKPLS